MSTSKVIERRNEEALTLKDEPKNAVRFGVIGIELESGSILLDSVVESPLDSQRVAEVIVRLIVFPLGLQRVTEALVGLGLIGLESKCF
jgi:hypothetical protein